jgi:hypothetical protein
MKPLEVTVLALERALALPAEHGLIAFTGPPTSGKTDALVRRFATLAGADRAFAEAAIVTAARDDGARALAERIAQATGIAVRGATLDALALELLRAHPFQTGLALDLELVDPLDAEEIFERAAEPLFSAEWSDWLGADVDPEIAGLRTPLRFAGAALRLIRKRDDVLREPAESRLTGVVVGDQGRAPRIARGRCVRARSAAAARARSGQDPYPPVCGVRRRAGAARLFDRRRRADRSDAAARESSRHHPRAAPPAARRLRR